MGTQYNPADDRTEKRHNAGFRPDQPFGEIRLRFFREHPSGPAQPVFSKHQQIPDWRNNESTRTFLDTERNVTALKLTADNLGYPGLNTAATFTHVYKEEEYDDSLGQIGLGKQHTVDETRRLGSQVFGEWLTDKNSCKCPWNSTAKPTNPRTSSKTSRQGQRPTAFQRGRPGHGASYGRASDDHPVLALHLYQGQAGKRHQRVRHFPGGEGPRQQLRGAARSA